MEKRANWGVRVLVEFSMKLQFKLQFARLMKELNLKLVDVLTTP